MLGEKITVLSAAQDCLCLFKKYKWNIPLSRISWNKRVWFVGWVSSFAWKPFIKWTFICVLANCCQKASLYCPVSSKICLSHNKSSISMPVPDKWGMSANTPPLSKYKMALYDCPSITPLALLNAFIPREVHTLMLEWNVPFYVSDKGVLIVLILCIYCWVQCSENSKRWSCANAVNLFLHVLCCLTLSVAFWWATAIESLSVLI